MNQRHFAKTLRQNMTEAERLLWKHLRAHRFSSQKFHRQQPIGPYIVDFVDYGAQLIIECDGGQHNDSEQDCRRDAWLNEQGFQVLRFWNHDILNQTESVLTAIFDVLNPLSPNPSPTRGEGDGGISTDRGNAKSTPLSPCRRAAANTTPLSPCGRGAGGEGKKQAKKQKSRVDNP